MIVDLASICFGHDVFDGFLWVIEDIPGLVVGADQTHVLETGVYFCAV